MKRLLIEGLPVEEKSSPIQPSSTVAEILLRYPRCVHVLRRFGLNCCACVNAEVDTIAAIARALSCPLPELLRELTIAAGLQNPNAAHLKRSEKGD